MLNRLAAGLAAATFLCVSPAEAEQTKKYVCLAELATSAMYHKGRWETATITDKSDLPVYLLTFSETEATLTIKERYGPDLFIGPFRCDQRPNLKVPVSTCVDTSGLAFFLFNKASLAFSFTMSMGRLMAKDVGTMGIYAGTCKRTM